MPKTCLVTALASEAKPLIAHFKMQAVNHPTLRLYEGDSSYLLQTGIGKLRAAANTAAALHSVTGINGIINAGIAGGALPIGDVAIAHCIKDHESGQQWYPHLPAKHSLPNVKYLQVNSVAQVNIDYQQGIAFDMEASGVFTAATALFDLAFIHSVKVISDNSEESLEHITAPAVQALMSNAIASIEQLMKALPTQALPNTDSTQQLSNAVIQGVHHTQTEQHALRQLLQRYCALYQQAPTPEELLGLGKAKQIRAHLHQRIAQAPLVYTTDNNKNNH